MISLKLLLAVSESLESGSILAVLTFLLAAGFAIVHIHAGKLRSLHTIPRSRWLSAAGGVSVAYVFVHIFPELQKGQTAIEQLDHPIVSFLEHHVYLLALFGFAAFYGLERIAIVSRQRNREEGQRDATSAGVFWLHISSFAIYNALIGYLLLHREEVGFLSLLSFFMAMALHFVVNDYGLREHHKNAYKRIGRWILAVAIFVGWVIGYVTEIHQAALAMLFAFLAGGVILNVLKEELPEERESRFWAFAVGTAIYAALLVAV